MSSRLNGYFEPSRNRPETGMPAIHEAILNVLKPVFIVNVDGSPGVCQDGKIISNTSDINDSDHYPLLSYVPPLHPENLGSCVFKNRYGIKYPYVSGAMGHGTGNIWIFYAIAIFKHTTAQVFRMKRRHIR
ncbi:MAG: hypothetical protein J7K96_11140 [Desulfobacteraceae bacterium]|nr:hypothetical protein [Desulfobacteraceae bacterium]